MDRRAGRLGRALEAGRGDAGAPALHPGRAENLGRRRGAGGAQALRGEFRRLVPLGPGGGAEWGASWDALKADAEGAGRDPAEIEGAAYVTVAINDDSGAAEAELDSYLSRYYNRPADHVRREQYAFAGDRAAVAGWLGGFVEAGATHLCVRVTGSDDARQMAELAELGKDFD